MKKFIVEFSRSPLGFTVEADNQEQAERIARDKFFEHTMGEFPDRLLGIVETT